MIIVKCPHCDREYLAAEIYVSKFILGKPNDIQRTVEGKILEHGGTAPYLDETFECEKCFKPFSAKMTIKVETEKITKYDFSEDYVSPIYGNRIILKE